MNHTTQTFARRSRGNGYEYAASIERKRRADWSGFWIVAVVATVYFIALGLYVWSKS